MISYLENIIEGKDQYVISLSRLLMESIYEKHWDNTEAIDQAPVVWKPINAYPRLKINRGFHLEESSFISN